MVSYIFLDSEQLLTYAFPPKNAKKYPKKIFLGHPTDFRGLKGRRCDEDSTSYSRKIMMDAKCRL